jgi:RecB family exonuclease
MFNIDTVLHAILAALSKVAGSDYAEIKSTAEDWALVKAKERLTLLAKAWLDGQITKEEMASYLKDELKILENDLLALEVITLEKVQELINAAVDLFQKILELVLPKEN